ncbi:type I polyketide synthase [Rhizobium sp. RAF56]|uniref:type I polyketide synthase n=1 Tax=Rhizobium sp. RAF56 TaxID=3233062 RepID=UPI003F96BDC4
MKTAAKSVIAEIAIIGAGARLPGVANLNAFWDVLKSGQNTIATAPTGRWSISRFLRPGSPEPGFAYSFAGGYLEDPFAFDPALFGISPREARQMDPQQRLLLEVAWSAFEDADIPPSSLSGQNVGVYVGASTVDYQSGASHDPAVMGSHYMTGNSLSILSNRISHAFDFRGASFTVDSACSSSFVALNEAMAALSEKRVDLALVAGANLLLSPAPFIGFSQARMLSPTGLSRPFSNQADGYVRSEGAVVILLRRLTDARANGEHVRSVVLGSAVNSDGRTPGISLPSFNGQRQLIETLYADLGLNPEKLAFVEAHGTGTKVGDPIEAAAIGEGLGQYRASPLMIGSAKSNVGHLECVSGLVGLLKSSLALQHRLLPRSLFSEDLNESIPFDDLNLRVAKEAVALDARRGLIAGVCNYGFGGTNAHVVIAEGDPVADIVAFPGAPQQNNAQLMLVSAATGEALQARVRQVSEMLAKGAKAAELAAALGHCRDILPHRLAVPLAEPAAVLPALHAFEQNKPLPTGIVTSASWERNRVGFVFSGNGCQFKEMGQAAYKASALFRAEIADIDQFFEPLSGWSIAATLHDGLEADRLAQTSVSQPLIFAIQSAIVAVLSQFGIRPDLVLGHSVGEVAAAEACGVLSREAAVNVIYLRSQHQEAVRGQGTMLVVAADEARTRELTAAFDMSSVEIAALNSPLSTTVSGPVEVIAEFSRACRLHKIATVTLDIEYPFHSSVLDPIRTPLIKDLSAITSRSGRIPFVSTVVGERIDGRALAGDYWWSNVRDPVLFRGAIAYAHKSGINCFVEIGPKSILAGAIKDTLRALGIEGQTTGTLSDKDPATGDPIMTMIARFVSSGLPFDRQQIFGPRRRNRLAIPAYPLQRDNFNLGGTSEALLAYGKMVSAGPRHILLGDRMSDGSPEWRNLLDSSIVPYLADHLVDGAVVVPGAALVEMTFQVGRELYGNVPLELYEFDVFKALAVHPGEIREVSTRWAEQSETLEILSRKRFTPAKGDWVLHARGTLRMLRSQKGATLPPPVPARTISNTYSEVYAEAARAGLEYGAAFRLVEGIERDEVTTDSRLKPPAAEASFVQEYVLHPISFDAALHGLFISRRQKDGETKAYMPVRFRKVRVWDHGIPIRRAITLLTSETDRFKTVAISLLSEDGTLVASIEAVVLRAVYLAKATVPDRTFHTDVVGLARPDLSTAFDAIRAERRNVDVPISPAWLLIRAFCVSLAHSIVSHLTEDGVSVSPEALIASGRVAANSEAYLGVLYDILNEFGSIPSQPDDATFPFPSPAALLATLMQRFPSANMEIRLAANALEYAERIVREGEFPTAPQWMLKRFESDALLIGPTVEAVARTLRQLADAASTPLRVLAIEPFGHGLTCAVSDLVDAGRIEVTFASPNAAAIEAQRQAFRADALVNGLVLNDEALDMPVAFDVLISLATSPLAADDERMLSQALSLLKTAAPVIVAVAAVDNALHMLRGLWQPWLERGTDGGVRGRIPTKKSIVRCLRKAGLQDLEESLTDNGLGHLILGRTGVRKFDENIIRGIAGASRIAVVVDSEVASLAADFVQLIEVVATGSAPDKVLRPWVEATPDEAISTLILPPHALDRPPSEQLAYRIEYLKGLLVSIEASKRAVRLFVITDSLSNSCPAKSGVESGIRGFVRVAINEFPGIDLRLIDVLPGADIEVIAKIVTMPGSEREWQVNRNGASVLRVRRGLLRPRSLPEGARSVLHFEYPGRVDSFSWEIAERRELAVGEIEIEVAAVGLNFRDVLVGLGILDDDLLGAGLTAASLGFECSGVVVRAGPGVTRLKVGTPVMGFAKDAFASHVIAPVWHFFPIPDGVTTEAAATIPVAFVTAWYALVERARLKKGEDVLIHGAAGGVGQAAIQIARFFGARVLGTASNDMRRRLGRSAGAELVFDSRQERFADAIASTIGGVDVVLNSLAGRGMHASLRLLKPFGRFIELGKRDFLDNTLLELRPFVRNLQYSGVDLDELLAHDRATVESIVADISKAFERRELAPLTYQALEAYEVGNAFRSMQSAEHIGKMIVRPPRIARENMDAQSFTAEAGVYLVIGGTSGFGFKTARWLAAKGATTLVLASRRGWVEPECIADLQLLRDQGVKVIVEALDVRDLTAVRELIDNVSNQYGSIRGVVHAAVALDDGLISSLTPERLRGVLGAKVEGVLNLDAALGDRRLDFFVVYSSATTMIGSPGQGAYVAANAFLEGFVRQRRASGKPALAIGWGAISDAGIVSRDQSLADRLRRTTGVVGIRASEALAQLGRLLVMGEKVDPVQFYSSIAQSEAAGKLALINSPAFSGLNLIRTQEGGEIGDDIASMVSGKTAEEALEIVTRMLRREVGQILRMPESQVDPARPMGELGLDSLMALELQLGIERLAGAQVPLVGISSSRLGDVAAIVLHHLGIDVGARVDEVDKVQARIMRLIEAHSAEAVSAEEAHELKSRLDSVLFQETAS